MTERLGRYRIVRLLARGGAGEVYLARLDGPGGFSRPVALKRLKPEYRFEPEPRRALIAEARVGALLDHPNILTYLELAEDGPELFIVAEYLHGVSARTLIQTAGLKGEFLPVSVALYLTQCLLEALAYAHEACDERGSPLRLVHRDISPENLLMSVTGAVKLIDFGIAQTPLAPHDTHLHVVRGKARYFSPEQSRGAPLSAASDLYSAALVLFELLCGTPAIHGEDERELLEAAQQGRVQSVRAIRPELPSYLVRLLERGLSPDVGQRFPSAHQFAAEVRGALQRLLPEHGPSELSRTLARFFTEDLETRRRTIWNDQSTAIVDTEAVEERRAAAPGRTPRHAAPVVACEPAAPPPPTEAPRPGGLNFARLRRAVHEAYTPSPAPTSDTGHDE